jgi:hypothetical protein
MTVQKEVKIKTLIKELKPGAVVLAGWLNQKGISKSLRQEYIKNGWLQPLGRGAYKRFDDEVEWYAGVSALQNQLQLKVHVGALTAMEMHGLSHYLRSQESKVYLFSPYKEKLPGWFINYSWKQKILHKQTSFLDEEIGKIQHNYNSQTLFISSQERAIMECLYLVPNNMDLVESYHLMEGLVNLRPDIVETLLLNCSSIKVKRLFLYMADKVNHQWLNFVNLDRVDLGNGNRQISKNGVYNSKYQLTLPKELVDL